MPIKCNISHFLSFLIGAKAKYKARLEINSFLIVINSIILLISCQNSEDYSDKKVFRYNSANGISSLDPAFARTQENIRAVNQLFNGLVQLNENLEIEASLAKSWSISEDGKLYTFKLRNDVLFHKHPLFKSEESRKLKASDFEYSFNRIIDPSIASDGAWIFNGIVDSTDAFKALNDSVFQIKLRKPFAPFLNMLSMAYCFVVPEVIAEIQAEEFGKHPVGTGPFLFANWEEGIKLNFIKNQEYFESSPDREIPIIDAVSISFVQSKQTALLQLVQNQLDIFTGLESSFKDEILSAKGELNPKYSANFELLKVPFLNTEYLAFNVEDPKSPFLDPNLRLAINYAINREDMVTYLRNGVGIAANGGFTPKGLPSHLKSTGILADVDKAKSYLSKVQNLPNKLILTTTKDYLDLCVLVQKDLKAIGLNIQIDVVPSSLLKQQKSAGEVFFFRSSWIADYPDGENYMACFYSKNKAPNGPNYTRFHHEEFDRLYEELIQSINADEKINLIQEMEQILAKELPYVLLFYDESIWIKPKNLIGIKVNPLNHLDLRRADLL